MQYSLLGKIINLCFPPTCAICQRPLVGTEDILCIECLAKIPFTKTWENPYDNEMAKMFWHLIPIERCGALFFYLSHADSAQLIYRLKYGNEPQIGWQLGRYFARRAAKNGFFEGIDAIHPVPLSKSRLRTRGYNQSLMIAEGITSLTHIPIITDAVRRTTFKESQTHKDRWQRIDNVNQVFELADCYHEYKGRKLFPLHQEAYPITNLAGKHILVIDDVCTTGATTIACCEQLKKLGNMKFSIATLGWARE